MHGRLFSPGVLDQIRSANDVVEVIGAYVPLKRAGTNFVALCPFHKEKSPSFHVNPQRQIFHCFGCHKGGDVFTFVKEYESIGFPEAVRRLAERARIPLEAQETVGGEQTRFLKETMLQIHEQITQRWQAALLNQADGEIARAYLHQRGVEKQAVDLFRIGYAPNLWDDTVNWAKSKGHELSLVEQSGLIVSKEGGQYYDRFRGRLMFPICDEQGRVVGFSGRILSGDEKTAKYVNSPETPLFTKGRIIFGLDKSKRALLESRRAIICEGQLDMIACFMAGVKNVVAPQGTALTADQCRILKRYADEVVLCFDSDNAGQNAAVRSLDPLLASGLSVRVAIVPAPHDPDSYIKESGAAAFQDLVENSQSFFDYYLNRLASLHDPQTDNGRMTIVKGMLEALSKEDNPVLTDTYAQRTALRLGVATDAVRSQFRKGVRSAARFGTKDPDEDPEEKEAPRQMSESFRQEIWLLKILLSREDLAAWIAEHLNLQWLVDDEVKKVVGICLQQHTEGKWRGITTFLDEVDEPSLRSLITGVVTEDKPVFNPDEIIKGTPTRAGLLENLRNQFVERELSGVNQALADPAISEQRQIELLTRKQSLLKIKKIPLVPREAA